MKYILKLNDLFKKFDERIGWPFVCLFIAAAAQLVYDVLLWKEPRRVDVSLTAIITGLAILASLLYKLWKQSNHRHRTILALLLGGNMVIDAVFTLSGIAVTRGLMIPIDVLWLFGLIALRYGAPNKKLFRPFTVREM